MEMCDLGENSPPFVSMPLSAMRTAVEFLSGERNKLSTVPLSFAHRLIRGFYSSCLVLKSLLFRCQKKGGQRLDLLLARTSFCFAARNVAP